MQRIVNGAFTFLCEDGYEVQRARSLYTKEPGTIAWLRDTLRPGDVFYDIGANIGCYSLVAAQLVGPTGHVYAFEPHVFNAASLLRNIQANGLQDVVTVLPIALGRSTGLHRFFYNSLRPGSSGHRLGYTLDPCLVSVLTQSMTLDAFQAGGCLKSPDVVKIDVDGNELQILYGIGAEWRVHMRSVQVEMPPRDSGAISEHMAFWGYQLTRRHYTQQGQKAVDAGTDPARITDNAIFERVAVAA
jgi:FkbM family methyltransferase